MFALNSWKRFQILVMGGALLIAVGCAQQAVKTEEDITSAAGPSVTKPAPSRGAEASMTEAERRRERARFRQSMGDFENALVHFDFDKSEIRPDQRPILDRKAQFLLAFPSVRVQIEGHCDERGTVEYNIALGHRRAQSSKDYLVSLGVDPSRIDTVSYGEERPIDPRHHELAWAKNRRAKFNVIGGVPAGMN